MSVWDRYVRPNWLEISQNLQFSPTLDAALLETGLLTYDDLEMVKSRATSYEKNSSLVWRFLAKRGPGALEKFCTALERSGPPNDCVRYLIERAMVGDEKTPPSSDAEGFKATEDCGHGKDACFPSDDSEVSEDLMRAITDVAASHWEKIAMQLISRDEMYDVRGSPKVKMMMTIANWRLMSDRATVKALLKACTKAGISKRLIKQRYLYRCS